MQAKEKSYQFKGANSLFLSEQGNTNMGQIYRQSILVTVALF